MNKLIRFFVFSALLLMPFFSMGQYGPMGFGNNGGNSTPEGSQNNLVLWLDGRSVDTSVPGVFRWKDKSGNGHDFIQTVVGLTPTLQSTGGPGATATPCVLFDGSDRLVCNSFSMSDGTTAQNEFSMYIVYRTADSKYGLFSYGPDGDPDEIALYGTDNDSYLNLGDNPIDYDALTGGLSDLQVGDLTNNKWQYQGLYWSAPQSRLWEYADSSSSSFEDNSSYASGFSFSAMGQAVIGDIPLAPASSDTYESGAGFDGQIAEIMIWEGFLTREKARLMRTYMWLKYGRSSIGEDFRESATGWDKFQGNYNNSYASKYYDHIAIGNDQSTPNPGQQNESRLNGLVLRKPTSWGGGLSYLVAGQVGTSVNQKVNTDLSTTPGVVERWSRVWEIRRNGGNQNYRIAFDFAEGINGDFPQNVSNYKLLRRSGNTGDFSVVAIPDPVLFDDEVVFTVPTSISDDANYYYTIGTIDIVASPLDGATFKTWFAFQTGNWNQPSTWTLDGSSAPSFINPGSEVPAFGDNVEIGSGRTVTITVPPITNDPIVQTAVRVDGILNLATLATPDRPAFSSISGSGIIRCAADNFPTGNTSAFADASTGGLVEFYGAGYVISNNLLLNKLQINLSAVGSSIALDADLTHNGLMEVKRGILYIDDPITTSTDSRTITSNANVFIEGNGRIYVSSETVALKHTWNFNGDLINNGLLHFTNRTDPSTALYDTPETSHWINARFISDTENQELRANGLHTYMSRIVINKGNDFTYELSISANIANRFKLLGHCNDDFDTPIVTESNNTNSCALINGTFRVKQNIFIPLHAGNGNYCIPPTVRLWVDGGIVVKGENTQGASFDPSVGTRNAQAIVPYGEVKVTGGMLNAWCTSGLTTRANGLIVIEGGQINANAVRTSVQGPSNIGGILISGGEVNINGNLEGGVNNGYYTFSLTYEGNLFRMTGGILRVAGPSPLGLIFINSDPEQTSVTGGTIIAEVISDETTHKISSRAPFWNLEIERTTTSSNNRPIFVSGGNSGTPAAANRVMTDQPLIVKNSLYIHGTNSPKLRMVSSSGTPLDLHVEGDFTIDNGGIYDHNLNTTFLEGDANTFLAFPTSNTVSFNDLVVNKATATRFVEIQRGFVGPTIAVEGEFRLENGFFENNGRNVDFLGDVDIRSNFGTQSSTGIARMAGIIPQILKSQNGVFHNFRIDNLLGVTLETGDLEVRKDLRLMNGVFFIQNYKVRIASDLGLLTVSSPSASRCFATDGSASAGGLEIINRLDGQALTFPIGVENGLGGVKYTPAFIRINGGWIDDGFIRVVPVDEILSTVDASGGVNFLRFYWRVLHSEYDNIPKVSHRFIYDDADIFTPLDEAEYASGRVLSELPFTRSFDSITTQEDHVITGSNSVYFNGPEAASTNLGIGPGTPLVNADYTAGNWERFVGQPNIYFSRSTVLNAGWEDADNWRSLSSCGGCSTPAQYHSPAANLGGGFPGAGDIAFIGFDPTHPDFKPHLYLAPAGGVQATLLGFTAMQDAGGVHQERWNGPAAEIGLRRPTLSFASTAQISNIGQITGEGALMLTGPADLNATDIGNFLIEDASIVVLQPTAALTLTNFPASVPNLFITTGPNGSSLVTSTIQPNVSIRGNLEIAGNAKLIIHSGSTGDFFVGGNLVLGRFYAVTSAPEILFSSNGNQRRFEVLGDVSISGPGARIQLNSPNTTSPQLIHDFIVWKDVYQKIIGGGIGLNFFATPNDPNRDFISLTVRGVGNHNFTNDGGSVPRLGRLIVDKGINTLSSFNFNGDVDIEGPSNLPQKSVDLRNGILTFDHTDIDITLSSGGGNFVIPGSAGLVLGNGDLRITSDETGILLDGLLQIDGGTFTIGDTEGENNFIEYSPSGNARIEVNGGNLLVGSQIRRGLTNEAGILKYIQTGGNVVVGRYDAPNANRAVFEILNPGSRFDHTGGTLTIARGNRSATKASLYLSPPVDFNVSGSSEIIIGGIGSVPNVSLEDFGIQSTISLNNLTIDNPFVLPIAGPEARVQVEDLSVNGLLSIESGSKFDFNNRNLTLRNDLINDGQLMASTGKLILEHPGLIPFSVSGSGVFNLFDLIRRGGGTTNIDSDLLVRNDYTQDDGIVNFNLNKLTLKGNAEIDGALHFDPSSNGLVFNGSGSQILRRSGEGSSDINTITIDNGSGVELIAGAGYTFNIEHWLRLSRGVFDLLGNVLVMNENARFEAVSSFGENNMINAGGAFTNFGVRVFIPNNSVEFRVIPLGIDKYMPILMKFEDEFGNTAGFSSGNNPGNAPSSYLFTLTNGTNIVVQEDDESTLIPSQPQIPDIANVLSMYFTVDADNIGTGLRMDMDFQYDDDYVNVTGGLLQNEEDYIAARVFEDASNNDIIQKFPESVDEMFNLIHFSYDDSNGSGDEEDLDGDYFAGVNNAIPEIVPVYSTTTDMEVEDGPNYFPGSSTTPLSAGQTPRGARVNITGTDILNVESSTQSIDFYRTDIAAGATLQIDGAGIHRLGRVTGSGTIRLINTGSLPSGNYNDFFVCNSGFGGKLEYQGTGGTVNVLANLSLVEKVDFTGTGTMLISNNDVNICTDLTIDGPSVIANGNALLTVDGDLILQGNGILDQGQGDILVMGHINISDNADLIAGNTGTTEIVGNLNMNGSTSSIINLGNYSRETILRGDFTKSANPLVQDGTNGAQLIFEGTSLQTISGNFTGVNKRIPYLTIRNVQGLNILGSVEVTDTLALTLGNINTSSANSLILQDDEDVDIVPERGSINSYVNGPLIWANITAGTSERVFPVGKDDPLDLDDRFRPLSVLVPSAKRTWTAEYFNGTASVDLPGSVANMEPEDPIVIKEVSIQEYWVVGANTGSPNARIGLSWGNNSAVSPNSVDYNKLVVLAYSDTPLPAWYSFGGQNFSPPPGETGRFESQYTIPFTVERIITLGSRDFINPLPVTWLYFQGETNGDEHILEWATSTEKDNDYFELERSIDAQNWLPVARITGAGYSTTQSNYSYTDRDAPYGRVYYRISQVDFDGKSDINPNLVSLEKALKSTSAKLEFVVYPNPTKYQTVRMMLPGYEDTAVSIMISDLSGKVLSEQIIQIDGQGISQQIDCNFNAGIYLVTVIVGNKIRSKPFVISK